MIAAPLSFVTGADGVNGADHLLRSKLIQSGLQFLQLLEFCGGEILLLFGRQVIIVDAGRLIHSLLVIQRDLIVLRKCLDPLLEIVDLLIALELFLPAVPASQGS